MLAYTFSHHLRVLLLYLKIFLIKNSSVSNKQDFPTVVGGRITHVFWGSFLGFSSPKEGRTSLSKDSAKLESGQNFSMPNTTF